jgi:hypothetical protein
MSWRPARSIPVLQRQLDAAYPGRSKASDGTVGDRRHTTGEHVPDDDVDGDGRGEGPRVDDIVRGVDVTNDPAHGCDTWRLAQALVASRDPRILYVISNRQICSSVVSPWKWRAYNGEDPHTGHLHMSLVHTPLADDTRPWAIGAPAQGGGASPAQIEEDELMGKADDILYRLDLLLQTTGHVGIEKVTRHANGPVYDVAELVRTGNPPYGGDRAPEDGPTALYLDRRIELLRKELGELQAAVAGLSAPQWTDAQVASFGNQVAGPILAQLGQLQADVDRLQAAQVAAGTAAAG